MSQTRRLRRESARQQAQQRLRRTQTASRRRRPRRWRNLPGMLFQRKTLAVVGALALAAFIAIPVFAPGAPPVALPADVEPAVEPTPTALPTNRVLEAPSDITLTPGGRYGFSIRTGRGTIGAELNPLAAPTASNNLYGLGRQRFYDNAQVLRVEPGKWVELGAKQPDGSTSPGYSLPLEPNREPLRVGSLVVIDRGEGMGSEFAILLTDNPETDATLHVFGRVNDGLDVARLLKTGDTITTIRTSEIEAPEAAGRP